MSSTSIAPASHAHDDSTEIEPPSDPSRSNTQRRSGLSPGLLELLSKIDEVMSNQDGTLLENHSRAEALFEQERPGADFDTLFDNNGHHVRAAVRHQMTKVDRLTARLADSDWKLDAERLRARFGPKASCSWRFLQGLLDLSKCCSFDSAIPLLLAAQSERLIRTHPARNGHRKCEWAPRDAKAAMEALEGQIGAHERERRLPEDDEPGTIDQRSVSDDTDDMSVTNVEEGMTPTQEGENRIVLL